MKCELNFLWFTNLFAIPRNFSISPSSSTKLWSLCYASESSLESQTSTSKPPEFSTLSEVYNKKNTNANWDDPHGFADLPLLKKGGWKVGPKNFCFGDGFLCVCVLVGEPQIAFLENGDILPWNHERTLPRCITFVHFVRPAKDILSKTLWDSISVHVLVH